jgi:hypothetical protein
MAWRAPARRWRARRAAADGALGLAGLAGAWVWTRGACAWMAGLGSAARWPWDGSAAVFCSRMAGRWRATAECSDPEPRRPQPRVAGGRRSALVSLTHPRAQPRLARRRPGRKRAPARRQQPAAR